MSGSIALSQADFSRHRGVSRKAVTTWKAKGLLVLTPDGLVDVDATEARLNERPAVNRGGVTSQGNGGGEGNSGAGNTSDAALVGNDPVRPASILDGPPEEIAKILDWSHAEAARIKEVYLALLRKQEFEVAEGKLVEIDEVARQVEREYAVVRERLLAIPGKLAAKLVGQDRAAIELALSKEINGALDELHDPDPDRGRVGSAIGEAEGNEGGA